MKSVQWVHDKLTEDQIATVTKYAQDCCQAYFSPTDRREALRRLANFEQNRDNYERNGAPRYVFEAMSDAAMDELLIYWALRIGIWAITGKADASAQALAYQLGLHGLRDDLWSQLRQHGRV